MYVILSDDLVIAAGNSLDSTIRKFRDLNLDSCVIARVDPSSYLHIRLIDNKIFIQ